MSARYSIRHELEFRYDAPVRGSVMTLFLSPVRDRRQQLHSFSIETDPGGATFEFRGPFGNRGHYFDRPGTHRALRIVARSSVEVSPPEAMPDHLEPGGWKRLASGIRTPGLWLMLEPSRFVKPSSTALGQFTAAHGIEREDDVLESIRGLLSCLYEAFEFAPGTTAADSPIEHILETGLGVCQDYAHVMISVLRGWGVPARYVSGYLAPDPGMASTHESHAWVECWLPGLGWCGFDPANNCDCDERHVRAAVGRDYADVPPVRGVFRGAANSALTTRVEVVREEHGGIEP
ncbi:MAG: transglutaminase family protein [Gammaproteobacteria bacterium]|nr:transglutaminase family protein [Gammaproteobacteria bacterium]